MRVLLLPAGYDLVTLQDGDALRFGDLLPGAESGDQRPALDSSRKAIERQDALQTAALGFTSNRNCL